MTALGAGRPGATAWRWLEGLGVVVVVGMLVVVGIGLPPLLPVALAGAARLATLRARRRAVAPLADAARGIREDSLRIAVCLIAFGGPAGVVAVVTGSAAAGALVALVPLLVAVPIASATSTPIRTIPLAAIAVVGRRPLHASAAACVAAAGLVPLLLGAPGAWVVLTAGAALLLAVEVAWRGVASQLP